MDNKSLRVFALALLALSPFANGDDGLVVQFTISESVPSDDKLQTYTNAVLMKFEEEASFELADQYVLKIRSHMEASRLDLLVTLQDVVEGKPYYIGASPVNLDIGGAAQVTFEENGRVYEISLDTSYGKLPAETDAK